MIAAFALAAVLAEPNGDAPFDFEVPPMAVTWSEVIPRSFDPLWQLPSERRSAGRDLLAEMERLVDLRFDAEVRGTRVHTLGDIVVAVDGRSDAEKLSWLEGMAEGQPALWVDWGAGLSQLMLDGELLSDDWEPDECHPRDGILVASAWDLAAEGRMPWSQVSGSTRVEQAAAIVRADLATLKAAENNYRAYPLRIGADYEAIYPVPRSHARGVDPEGREFATLELYFRCDLPFPYSDYECNLQVLNRIDSKGRLVTDIYSESDDFHWLAGRDVFLPVADGSGKCVAYLQVRQYGFDLDGVPDGASDRRTALRSSLGNLKREAEALSPPTWNSRDGVSGGVLPPIRVLGQR